MSASFKWSSKKVIENHESHSQNKTVYCTFGIFRILLTSPARVLCSLSWLISTWLWRSSRGGRLWRSTVLPSAHHHRPARQKNVNINWRNQPSSTGCSPNSQCTCEYYRHKSTFWQEPGPSRSKGGFLCQGIAIYFSRCVENSHRTLGRRTELQSSSGKKVGGE